MICYYLKGQVIASREGRGWMFVMISMIPRSQHGFIFDSAFEEVHWMDRSGWEERTRIGI